ncbi:MAG TPA: primosomal protein N', partial [Bacillota bacterium]|nr:primosomal protein N' [Bacillota bacterium]
MEKMYAEVIVSNKCKETDRTYSYLVPENMKESIRVGSRVIVPFGVGNKQIEGYVVGLKGSIDFKPSKIKSVARLLD